MKTLTLIVLLVTSQFTHAITASELDCVARSTYLEARSLPKQDWLKIANVAHNRSRLFKTYHFGSRSSHLCDVVSSRQYTSHSNLHSKLQEAEVFREIKTTLQKGNWKTMTNALYFETKNRRMFYNTTWRK